MSQHGHLGPVDLVEGTGVGPWADAPEGGRPERRRRVARAWSTDGVADLDTAAVAGHTVVVRSGPVDDSSGQLAIDLRTGEPRWHLPERPGSRELCGGGDARTVACVVFRYGTTAANGYAELAELAELALLDAGVIVPDPSGGPATRAFGTPLTLGADDGSVPGAVVLGTA